uniref:Uncharacterized protein n=1 Tax=Tetradesmus obliquus TaxID=3088 RepID=A0A383WD00_TETOB|eukprot:jgi/Sobl393_1/4494/SZX75072.1
MLAASPRIAQRVHLGCRAAPLQLRQPANVVSPRGCRSNFKCCYTAKPGSQVSSQQGQGQPPGGGGKVPRTPSPGGSDGNDDQQPRDNSFRQGWSALTGALLATQPAVGMWITLVGAVGAIVHALIAPLSVKLDSLNEKMNIRMDYVSADIKELRADIKELRADIQQLLIRICGT